MLILMLISLLVNSKENRMTVVQWRCLNALMQLSYNDSINYFVSVCLDLVPSHCGFTK